VNIRETEMKKKMVGLVKGSVKGRACRGTRSGSPRLVPLRVLVRWLAAKKIRLPYFRSLASGLGRGACMRDVGRSWSLRLRQFHIQVLLLLRPVGAEIVLGSEFRLGFLVPAWIHGTRGDGLGWCPEGGAYRSVIRLWPGFRKAHR
jgi:hypothetical protein